MSDPQVPVERGLRATVRLAAGINTGEDVSLISALQTHIARLPWLRRLVAAAPRRAIAASRGLLRSPLLRHGAIGAVAGTGIVGVGFAVLAAQAVSSAEPAREAPREVLLSVVEAAAKADRLPTAAHGGKLAAIAGSLDGGRSVGTDLVITTRAAATDTTVAMPALAYASPDVRDAAVAAIDRVLDAPPIAAVRPANLADEEDDDESVVPLVLPMPRARPEYDATVTALPLPRPRPTVLASLAPPRAEAETAPPGVDVGAPARAPSSNALGFFSSPAEPVRPPSKTIVDTPFGVPYVLQTGSVETACLKPELVEILRHIEGHYHQKVVITSGFRDRGRQGSLHRQCAAADIQVPGVSAAQLASYARTVPQIGGVGTYCHPSMIHVDIGAPRDWKYGCGSFFAMRGGPAHWGKVPGNLAKAQTAAAAAEAD